MVALRSFDELNVLYDGRYSRKSMPYEQYFADMGISREQKQERIDFSKKLEDILLFALLFIGTAIENNYINHEYMHSQIKERYGEFIDSYIGLDDYLDGYIDEFTMDFINATVKNKDNPYYFSEDRLVYMTENEANTVLNYTDFDKALNAGYKKKVWITEKDKKVRKTHRKLDEKAIPIVDAFMVGESLMLFPKDTSFGASAEEIVGCRCSIKYTK